MLKRRIKRIKSIEELLEADKERQYFNNWKTSELKRVVSSDYYSCFLINQDEEVAGYVVLSTVLETAEIIYLYINKRFRTKGLGFLLLKEVFNELNQKNNITEVFLEVSEDNKIAKQLYENLGFRQIGIRRKYYDNKFDAIIYRLDL